MKTYLIHRNASSLVAAIAVAVLTACGGGGDSAADSVAAISPGPTPGVVTTPAAASKAWGTARLIDADNTTQNETSPWIAMDASGKVLAGWLRYDGTRPSLWSSFSMLGNDWSKAMPLPTNNADTSFISDIKFDANGNALAVGMQRDGTQQNIWANRYTPGIGWGTAARIKTNDKAVVEGLKIAFDASSNAMVVWSQSDNANPFNIWANRYTPGSGWGTAELIESDNTGSASGVEIAFDPRGNALAVWQQSDGNNRLSLYANRYTPGGGWGTAALIETNEGDASHPKIALDASGNALVVWTQSEGSRFSRTDRSNIWTNRYTPGDGWGTAKLIDANNARLAIGAKIAMNASGNAMAVWFQTDSPHSNIWANRYTPGSGWGTPEVIETDNAGDASNPQIAMDADGSVLAVWRQSDDGRFNIRTNRYIPGSGWSKAAALIEYSNARYAYLPQIAMNASGNAVAVWQQSDGPRQKVWVASYR